MGTQPKSTDELMREKTVDLAYSAGVAQASYQRLLEERVLEDLNYIAPKNKPMPGPSQEMSM